MLKIITVVILSLSAIVLSIDPALMPSVELKNAAQPGLRYPAIGLGVGGYGAADGVFSGNCSVRPEVWAAQYCPKTVYEATLAFLKNGGRRIDGANSYANEVPEGQAIIDSGIPRKEIFITSKMGPSYPLGYQDAIEQTMQILKDLKTDYVDLLLIHFPADLGRNAAIKNSTDPTCNHFLASYDEQKCRINTWKGLEVVFKRGLAKAIGVSNYNVTHIQDIIDLGGLVPAVNQVPFHPYISNVQFELLEFCKKNNILFNGYSPFGVPDWWTFPTSTGMAQKVLDDKRIQQIASKYGKTLPQIILNWSWQVFGIPTQPRTKIESHMIENLEALVSDKIKLTDEEIKILNNLPQATCKVDPFYYSCDGTNHSPWVIPSLSKLKMKLAKQ